MKRTRARLRPPQVVELVQDTPDAEPRLEVSTPQPHMNRAERRAFIRKVTRH